ncbi:SDR family NAD(P)-dependent oxidoreductase [Rhodococcus sp. WAY2]|uniref:SDR family NAD(P)-dependent oxidoreductase n=1 Tax=Rhodococcus sp. WAY2 TaxID=2663121 RepID=UPI00135BED82|nr:SDR family oxidoreductase [Rhodococcus sp. WAY2]
MNDSDTVDSGSNAGLSESGRSLAGHVAVVTGGARGIGLAITRKLASASVAVVVNDLTDISHEVAHDLRRDGYSAVGHTGDVTDPAAIASMVASAVENFGGLDIVVNNAGYSTYAPATEMSDEQWQSMLDLLLTAPFKIAQAAAPYLFDGASGRSRRIITISSVGGITGSPGAAGYAAAKSGVFGLTKTLAKEFGPHGVTVNAVAPGLIRTRLTDGRASGIDHIDIGDKKMPLTGVPMDDLAPLVPLRRLGTPEDVAGAVYMLCIPEADYITGETVVVAGGWMP